MIRPLPSVSALRNALDYDPLTGKLRWKARSIDQFKAGNASAAQKCSRWNGRFAGELAFTAQTSNGYFTGMLDRRQMLAHRVIWVLVHGEWPADQIDHINGNPSDNRISNLRVVDDLENRRNQKMNSRNTSGVPGVSRCKDSRWEAHIGVKGQKVHLGHFSSFDAACKARIAAERKYGFHENHGRTDPEKARRKVGARRHHRTSEAARA